LKQAPTSTSDPGLQFNTQKSHPLVFLLGFIYGAMTMGLPGLFIGPLILGITYEAYKLYRKEKVKSKQTNLEISLLKKRINMTDLLIIN
jgi:predicted PurR-regulated permease PerM